LIEKRNSSSGALADSWYNPGGFFYGGGAGSQTKSGTSINERNALQLAVVWCCIKILSEDSASLPLHLYRRLKGGGKERATDHPLYSLLHDSPNPEMTAFSFRETGKAHLLGWGNWYAEKVYGRGTIGKSLVQELWPITPHRVTVKRDSKKKVYYHISMAGTDLPDVDLPKEKILHIPGLSYDGLIGYSPIAAAREAIGMGKALEEFGQLYFGNGIHPSIVISTERTVKDPKAYKDALNESLAGLGNAHRVMLLEEATKVEKLGIPNDEAQFLETRKFQNIDIGTRIYRVPPYMYGEMDKTAFANVEQQAIDYVTKTLRPWLVRVEQSLNMSLLNPAERSEYFFEHLVDGLLRGDVVSRFNSYSIAKSARIYTTNEIREMENRNPIEGGDKLDVTPNMMPKDKEKEPKEPEEQKSLRSGLKNAYLQLFTDAIGRVTRKEAQRINWLRKNNGNIEDFYRELPEYIRKQCVPAFLSFAESLNGIDTRHNIPALEGFVTAFCVGFSQNYIEESRKIMFESGEWVGREAGEIAEIVLKKLLKCVLNETSV
jgi:HK97 family phage portal protein